MDTYENMNPDNDHFDIFEDIQVAVKEKKWRVVEKISQMILKRLPNNSEALMYLGIARAAQGFEPEGETLLLASLTLNPKSKEAYYNLGLIVLEQGRCILAADAFQHGLKIDPADHAILYQLGRTYEMLDKHEEALDLFERALRQTPADESLDFTVAAKEAIQRIQKTT